MTPELLKKIIIDSDSGKDIQKKLENLTEETKADISKICLKASELVVSELKIVVNNKKVKGIEQSKLAYDVAQTVSYTLFAISLKVFKEAIKDNGMPDYAKELAQNTMADLITDATGILKTLLIEEIYKND